MHLYGVDKINPEGSGLDLPIAVRINGLDFSGADFFPATLLDNDRVVTFGEDTAGAFGFVSQVEIPNQLGVGSIHFTQSNAVRANGKTAEGVGVPAQFRYVPTLADLQGRGPKRYAGLIHAANVMMKGLVEARPN